MSQYISTESQEMVQVASNRGWSDFCAWARASDVEECPSLHHLIKFGYDNDPGDLKAEIESELKARAPDADIRSTADGLLDFLGGHGDADIIIVSDGLTSASDDD